MVAPRTGVDLPVVLRYRRIGLPEDPVAVGSAAVGAPPQLPVRVRVLGPVRVGRGGAQSVVTSPRQRRLLAALAAGGRTSVPTDTLIDVAWGDHPAVHPVAALHTQLSRLRGLLGAAARPIRAEGAGYRLALDRAAVDAWRFEDLVDTDGGVPAETLRTALALWGGGAFADADDHPAVRPVAARLEELRRRAVEDLATAQVHAGCAGDALAVLGPLLADDPFRERARAVELQALYAAGRAAEALAHYRSHCRLLAAELGTRPSPLVRQVVQAILEEQLPTEPMAGDLPPRPGTSFVGRDEELDLLARLLRGAHVVSVLGPAGVGKTRLALHACHAVRTEYEDGVWWCDLAQAAPGDVATVVAARLGIRERAGVALPDRIASVIGHRRALVVLDNCEHAIPEAGALAHALVRRGDGVVVLATSRSPLGVDAEHRVRLAPLPVAECGPPAAAVRLFLDRARAVDPGFQPDDGSWAATVELCRGVGGLPLALELAAACVGRLDVVALAERVGRQLGLLAHAGRARADRHGSLPAVLDSAYRLLPRNEQTLLDRLSVFAGPFTLDTVEALDGGPETGVALGGLVDNSMVQLRPDGRYELLPPVRAHAGGRLTGSGTYGRCRARHAETMVAQLGRIDGDLRSTREPLVHRAVDDALADLRVARDWLLGTGDLTRVVELSAATHWFTFLRTRPEVYQWADDVVARVDADPAAAYTADGPARLGQARACAAMGAAKRGDLRRARGLAEVGVARADAGTRFCLEILGQVALFEGRLEEAADHAVRSARLHREAGDEPGAINAGSVEVVASTYAGQRALTAAQRFVRSADALGVPSLQAMMSYILAEATTDVAEAMSHYQRAIDLADQVGAEFVTGVATTSLAARELRHGRHDRARRRLGSAIDLWCRAGVWNQGWLGVRLLVEALHHDGDHEAVAVLATAHAAARHAGPAYGTDAVRLADATAAARRALGAAAYERATHRGACLGDEAALAYALRRARRA